MARLRDSFYDSGQKGPHEEETTLALPVDGHDSTDRTKRKQGLLSWLGRQTMDKFAFALIVFLVGGIIASLNLSSEISASLKAAFAALYEFEFNKALDILAEKNPSTGLSAVDEGKYLTLGRHPWQIKKASEGEEQWASHWFYIGRSKIMMKAPVLVSEIGLDLCKTKNCDFPTTGSTQEDAQAFCQSKYQGTLPTYEDLKSANTGLLTKKNMVAYDQLAEWTATPHEDQKDEFHLYNIENSLAKETVKSLNPDRPEYLEDDKGEGVDHIGFRCVKIVSL